MIKINGKEYQEVYFVWEGLINHSRINNNEYSEEVSCVGVFSTKEQAIKSVKKAYSYYKKDNNNIVGELKEGGKEEFYVDKNGKKLHSFYTYHSFYFDLEYKEGTYAYAECGYSIEKIGLDNLFIFGLDPECL